jgi:hypothetical protein
MSLPISGTPTTDEQLRRLLEASPEQGAPDSVTKPFAEKRDSHRFPFRGRAKAVLFPSAECPPGTTLLDSDVVTSDLSRGGVSFLCRSRLQTGQQLMLMLSEKMQLAEVRWCCPVWNELFIVGCQFLSEPNSSILDQQLTAIDVVISNEASWLDPRQTTTT